MKHLLYLISMICIIHAEEPAKCKSEIDSITRQRVYTTADTEPMPAGGESALQRAFYKDLRLDSVENISPVTIAFIVDKDSSIKGERVLQDNTQSIGRQILKVIRSYKWVPGKCNGKDVRMLVKRTIIIDTAAE